MRKVSSFCRVCHAGCGVALTIDDLDRIVDIRGDQNNTMSKGYACFKGIQAAAAHHGPERLLHSLKRQADGSHARIPSEQALDEIAEKIRMIRDRNGPDAIALYAGGGTFFCASMIPMYGAILAALGSESFFTPLTIDQPNKYVSADRMGGWGPGIHDLEHSEVALLLGTNPLVSHQAYGLLLADPTRRLKAAKARGLRLICIDPRYTETARHADIYLQPVPGQDPAILAGMIRLILSNGWQDHDFCERFVGAERLGAVKTAVSPFTPDVVAQRAGLGPDDLYEASALFARDHKTGSAVMTTGGSFAPFANLTQHLLDLLNVICGRLKRAGDYVSINMIEPAGTIYEEVTPPTRSWETAPLSRIRGVGSFFGQKLTPTLAEEILEPGKEQIKCLIMAGGNPASVVPDQPRMMDALRSLELSVTIDPWFTSSAQFSDYIIAPTMMYERADVPFSIPNLVTTHNSYGQFTPALIKPPVGSDVIDDWYFFWGIACRLGLELNYDGVILDMAKRPTTEQLLETRTRNARVTLDELRQYPSGKEFSDHPDCIVAPARPGSDALFDVMPGDVSAELAEFLATFSEPGRYESNGRDFRFLLSTRRSHHIFNSTLSQLPEVRKRNPFSPAFIHPDDMVEMDICEDQMVEIESDYGKMRALAHADKTMRRSVISVTHGWDNPSSGYDRSQGNVNALVNVKRDYGAINAMPRMSAIPVNIRPVRAT